MVSYRYYSLLVCSLLAILGFQSASSVDNLCAQDDITTYGSLSLSAQCTWSTITVDIVDSSSDFDYSRALYYVCDSANISGSLLESVPATDFRTSVIEEVDLPPGTICTVFGCYVEFDGGYQRLFINGSCTTDIDECDSLEPCHEQATCTNTDGSYTCACNPGFAGDGNDCEDVDECSSDALNNCHEFANTVCNNTIGSFDCICNSGYNTSDGDNCTDIDECEFKPCHEQATCTNTNGNYTCTCNLGFTGDGISCEDVDECFSDALNNCHEFANTICNNTIGSFDCVCSSGFNTSDGENCTDINECESKPCHEQANCTNMNGNYTCACNLGFTGDGISCEDVNECSSNALNNCHELENTICNNTIGSFDCVCSSGFNTSDGNTCTDVDECENQSHNCHESAHCNNTIGSYECSCKPGFHGNGVDCNETNECSLDEENDCHTFANSVCHNTIGSYECLCKPGYRWKDFNCTATSDEVPKHAALGVGLTLFFILVVAGGTLTLVLVLRSCRRGRRNFRHYKFNVHSEVDLTYNPRGIQLDTLFSFKGSIGSILHELRYDGDRPIMTETGSGESDGEEDQRKVTQISEVGDVKKKDAVSGGQSVPNEVTTHRVHDDDSSSISTHDENELLYSGTSDCNSSRGMASSVMRMHSNPSSTGGYISEQSGGLTSPGYSAWNEWQSGGNQVPLNTKCAKTDYLTENAISASQVRVGVPVGGSSSETTTGSTQTITNMEDIVLEDTETYGDTKHHMSSTPPAGYVSNDQHTFPSSGQSSTGAASASDHTGERPHPVPTQPPAVYLPQPPTAHDTTIHIKHTQEPPPLTTTARAASLVSLNIITDLEQAFPRFASEESLYRHYAPATALPSPYLPLNTSRARSEINLSSVPVVCTPILNHAENAPSLPLQTGILSVLSRPNSDTPSASGGGCPTPKHLAPDLIADTPSDDFPDTSTKEATEHSNTHIVPYKSTQHTWSTPGTAQMSPELGIPPYPNYINLDSAALFFTAGRGGSQKYHHVSFEVPQVADSIVVSEECGLPLHSTASPTTTVLPGLRKASYQQHSLQYSASDDSECKHTTTPQQADNSSAVSGPYVNTSVLGFHNTSFDLPETLVENEIEDP